MATSLPTHMRAVQVSSTANGIENALKIADIALPKDAAKLPRDHVLIQVTHASLNPVDYKVLESPAGYVFSKPFIPAVDYAGIVASSNSTQYKPGDRVYGVTKTLPVGALAEYIVNTGQQRVCKAPAGLSLQDASTIGVAALTAYQSLQPFVKSGDNVLIVGGSGGVGTFAVQMAKVLGCRVTTVCSGANVELCKSLGADEVIDYKSTSLVDELKKPGRQPFDYILDCIFPDVNLYWQAHHYLKKGCRFVTIAGAPTLAFVRTALAIFLKPAFLGGEQRPFKFVANSANAEGCGVIANWIVEGRVRVIVQDVFDLEETAQAYTKQKSGRTRGKVIVKVAPE